MTGGAQRGRQARGGLRALGAVALLALVAAACGGGGGDDGDDAATGPTTSLEPQAGGKLIYGLEAETDGFDPARSRWAASGFMMAFAVMDPLAYFDADGVPHPYLAESIEPNETYDVWTITLRDGVTFHDGSSLDSGDLVYWMDAHKASGLTQDVMSNVAEWRAVDDRSMEITMSEPWVAFPSLLVSQVGVLPPEDYDELWGPASDHPIGTGPFRFVEWVRDDHFLVERNPDYWREGLPLLDQVEFKPVPDANTRADAFRAGDLDVFHLSDPFRTDFEQLARQGDARYYPSEAETEEIFLILNTAAPPFDDVRMRRALAHAIDLEEYQVLHGGGVDPIAQGAFVESSPWYEETPEYPQYDPAEAKRLVEDYVADGGDPGFRLQVGATPAGQRVLQWLLDTLGEVGLEPDATALPQTELILGIVTGDFEASYFRQFGGPDPDMGYVWWHGDNAKAPGEGLSLNMTRLDDDQVNDALERGRTDPDPEARHQAYADLQHRWAELVPYVWLSRSQWAVVTRTEVHGIETGELPDGAPGLPFGGQFAPVHLLVHTWLEQ